MFERYTEHARRVIFFARYETSVFGSPEIKPEFLLLAILREDPVLANHLPAGAREAIRQRVEAGYPLRERLSTSVDIPMNMEAKRVLAYGDDESSRLNHRVIACGHLVLGLLRLENCLAADLLRENGIQLESYRTVVASTVQASPENVQRVLPRFARASENPGVPDVEPAAASLKDTVTRLSGLVMHAIDHLDTYSEHYGDQMLKRLPWSRKEALGHLVDWATTHHRWLGRAMTEPKFLASGYPQQEWVAAQHYSNFVWRDMVDLWVTVNRLLIHVMAQVTEEKASMPCRIGIEQPIPLRDLIGRYVAHCDDVVGQILAHL